MSTTTPNLQLTQPQMTDEIEKTIPQLSNDLLIIDTAVGKLGNLTTTNKTSLVNAINEIDVDTSAIATNTANIGTLTSLTTTAKNNLVSAINEVNSEADSNTTAIGALSSLTTTAKNNLVAAVNEVNGETDANTSSITTNTTNIASNTTAIGTIANLNTTSKTNLVSSINEVIQYPVNSLSRQAIINGNFDVWQRGTSFTNPASGAYTTDRWGVIVSNSGTLPTTIAHSRQVLTSGDIPNSYYFYRINVNGPGSGFGATNVYELDQVIENGNRYLCGLNKKITISFYARSDIAGKKIGVRLIQGYGLGGAPSASEVINGNKFTLTSTWTKYSITVTTNTLVGKTFGTNNDDSFNVNIGYMWGSTRATQFGDTVAETFVGAGNIDIAQLQVNSGDSALPFQPKSVDEVSTQSLRYAWIPQTNSVFVRMTSFTANTLVFDVPLTVQMRSTPTIKGTVNTDIVAYNMSGAAQTGFTAAAVINSHGVTVTLTKTAHGLTDAFLEIKITSGFEAEM